MPTPHASGRSHYIPILKLMPGELKALEFITSMLRARITPLLEVRPPKEVGNARSGTSTMETMDKVLKDVGTNLATSLKDGRAFIDTIHIPDEKMASGDHPLTHVLAEARKEGVALVPVTGPERSSRHHSAVKKVMTGDGGVCIRVRRNELFSDDLDEMISSVLAKVGSEPSSTDLLLDLGQVNSADVNLFAKNVVVVLASISGVTRFRTLTLSAGAFPESLSHIDGAQEVHRADWALWQAVRKKAKSVVRMPAFSDYAVQNVAAPSTESFKHSGSANIRYTLDEHWLVIRGKSLTRSPDGYSQYTEMARYLANHKLYAGRDFSAGDTFIDDCARGKASTGNASTWRRVGTSHHIAQTVKQLTSFGET